MKFLPTKLLILALSFATSSAHSDSESGWGYGSRGWEWSNPETGSYLWLGLRMQTRYSTRNDEPLVPEDLREEGKEGFSINRARYKIGGGLGRHFTFYHEYDLRNGQLLDLRATWKPASWFNLRAGQWKSEFSRERIDSSGKQQFVERSVANYWFTIDRQNGVMASGRVAPGKRMDSSWWLGVLQGNGLNTSGDGGRPMVMGRYQWNFTRNVLPFSQSALKQYDEPHGALTFAFVTNDSPYTRFSSGGGGNLPGYEQGQDNQYRTTQFMQELAWHRGPWSFQQELHFKEIKDRVNGGKRKLHGGYAQLGWFGSNQFPWWPEPLEVAGRLGLVDPDRDISDTNNIEVSLAANWFFNGHRNKLTTDVSFLEIGEPSGAERDVRFRLQWDISL